jgi:MoaA/NifB/PqqE/SkfB family radical SAM enzyme
MQKLQELGRVGKRFIREIWSDLQNREPQKAWNTLVKIPKVVLFDAPYVVNIEPTSACNLRCEFCSAPPELLQRKSKTLRFSQFKRLIDAVAPLSNYVCLFLGGEPFLNREVTDMIQECSRQSVHSIISSNLSISFREEQIEAIVSAKLDKLIVSIDAV